MSHRLLISAAHKSSGKTTVSIGLCAALRQRGLAVQPFKKGPDYIDPMWLSTASGRACRNLDLYLMEREEIARIFHQHASQADVSLVEGNKGLYDGLALDGSNSNAALAKQLDLPVVLVLDARGMTRGIAPLILGYQAFDRELNIAGVILNNLGGSRHEAKLRAVIEHYTDVPVIGAVHQSDELEIDERHLGLMPSNESAEAAERVAAIGRRIAAQVDLERLLTLSVGQSCLPPAGEKAGMGGNVAPLNTSTLTSSLSLQGRGSKIIRIRIGIARDRAFGFYYADDLDALAAAGAELIPFDTLSDARLPEVDALFIGGGFPEMFAPLLEANASLRADIRRALAAGLPAYAECGGLMYLARSLSCTGGSYEMVGAIPGDVHMHAKPVGRGYVHLEITPDHLWAAGKSGAIRAHEFHYSSLDNLPEGMRYAYRVVRGHGIDGERDGLVIGNLLASYTHLRSVGSCHWADRFVAHVRRCKLQQSE